ncbi:MAG: ArgE/DapE family deacylase [Deltaproteobacteria bacterium]|nr:ArgE/DapE family deacylase [Deltaproteobacteria bacterium]
MKNIKVSESILNHVSDVIEDSRDELIELCQKLVQTRSINPLSAGVDTEAELGGEKRCNEILRDVVAPLGASIDMFEVELDRTNLVATFTGEGGGRSLIFNGHIDTVPVGNFDDWKWGNPFSGKIEQGRIYGRGACDMKGGLCAQVMAAKAIVSAGFRLRGDLLFESVVGEETMSHELGTTAVIDRGYLADGAIVSEPSGPPVNLAVEPSSCGLFWMRISCIGKSTHSSVRWHIMRPGGSGSKIGVNAIEKGVLILNALQQLEQQWGITKTHPLFLPGQFTIHPGVIEGGPAGTPNPYIVSEYCQMDYAVWFPPHENSENVKKEIETYIQKAASLDPWLEKNPPKVEWMLHWPPFNVDVDFPLCTICAAAHESATGTSAVFQGFTAVNDAAYLNARGIPAITYGPGSILVAHAVNEFVDIEELMIAAKTYAISALEWCGVVA